MLAFYLTLLSTEQEKADFERLYYDHRKLVKHIALDITRNEDLAEEATQETFLKIVKFIKKFDGLDDCQSKSLVAIIARRAAVDYIVKEQKHSVLSLTDVELEKEPQVYETPLPHTPLLDAINALPKEQCELLQLLYYYGFSGKKAAAMLGINYATLRKRLQRAKSALRTTLEEMREE